MPRKRKISRAGRTSGGRFKRTKGKGKNAVAVRLGRKGHRASCRGKG